jgi:hypothetical protein
MNKYPDQIQTLLNEIMQLALEIEKMLTEVLVLVRQYGQVKEHATSPGALLGAFISGLAGDLSPGAKAANAQADFVNRGIDWESRYQTLLEDYSAKAKRYDTIVQKYIERGTQSIRRKYPHAFNP